MHVFNFFRTLNMMIKMTNLLKYLSILFAVVSNVKRTRTLNHMEMEHKHTIFSRHFSIFEILYFTRIYLPNKQTKNECFDAILPIPIGIEFDFFHAKIQLRFVIVVKKSCIYLCDTKKNSIFFSHI